MRRFLLFLFIAALIGAGVWIFFFKKDPAPQEHPLSSGGTFQSFLSSFSNTTAPTEEGGEGSTTAPEEAPEEPVILPSTSAFKRMSTFPVAGATAFTTTKTVTVPATDPKQKPTKQTVTEHIVRYVARASGYVYEIKDGGIPTQISNTYIPNVYEALFADGGRTAVLRFLRDDNRTIASHSVPIPEQNPDGTRTQLAGTYLPDDIAALALAPDGKLLARLTIEGNSTVVTTTDTKNGARKELLRHSFQNWLLLWPNQNLYLQTKATVNAPGFLYRIDAATKRLAKVVGGIQGLTTSVSPKGTYVLYSQSNGTSFSTALFITKSGETKRFPLSILPEKCAWLQNEELLCAGNDIVPQAQYPDAWYMGLTGFTDKLYRLFPLRGTYEVLDGGREFSYDATNLVVDEADTMLYFIDKASGFLWQFDY